MTAVRELICTLVIVSTALTVPAAAADLSGSYLQRCEAKSQSSLSELASDELLPLLLSYFEAGKEAMSNPVVRASRSPAFTWANETRLACGEAVGYLKGGHLDAGLVAQCDCFHQRYISFR